MNNLSIHYQEVSLDAVLRYYAEGFNHKPDEKLVDCETVAVDVVRGKVVFITPTTTTPRPASTAPVLSLDSKTVRFWHISLGQL